MRDRLTVEKLVPGALDVRDLNRAGLLTDNWVMLRWPSLRWPAIVSLRLTRLRIEIGLRGRSAPQLIRISWTPCNYGGSRPWLQCPGCDRRVARLLKGFAGYFCRACCGNPIYESQRRSEKSRLYLQAYRIRQRLGGSRPVLDAIPPRPRGMRRTTYARLCAQLQQLEEPLRGSRVLRYAPRWIPPLGGY